MEEFDLYTYSRKKTGSKIVRGSGEKIPEGSYRLVVGVLIFNSKGELLIQQRAKEKTTWTNLWDISCAGHVQAGETSQEGASRELKEELGLTYDFTSVPAAISISFPKGFEDFYILHLDLEPGKLNLQKDEVQKVMWASKEKVLEMLECKNPEESFIPYEKSFLEYCFYCSKKQGLHTREDWTRNPSNKTI